MQKTQASPLNEFQLQANFEKLRQRLLADGDDRRLDRPLGFWALPSDRRLPMALLDRKLRDLLSCSFQELCATPGIGRKKINTLLILLARADAARPDEPADLDIDPAMIFRAVDDKQTAEKIDPDEVSDEIFARWREAIVRCGYDHYPLGRFAPSLRRLPRVLWYTPLSTYTGLTLSEIRQLKTHGEKRVAALIEVFGSLYRILRALEPQPDLAVKIVPRIVTELEEWVGGVRSRRMVPNHEEIHRRLTKPLLVQLRLDGGEAIERLVRRRLGLAGTASSVKHAASHLGLTRARVYQLLADVAEMMRVRWPEGPRVMQAFKNEMLNTAPRPSELDELVQVIDLFFPQ